MYPAIIAAAFFTAVVLNDIFQSAKPMTFGKNIFFGIIAIVGLWALEARGLGIVAWGLLVIPAVVFASGFLYTILNPLPKPLPPPPKPAPPPPPKPEEPAVQLPDENTVCVELEFDPSKPEPHPLPSCDVGADGTIGMPGTLPLPAPVPSCPTGLSSTTGTSGSGAFTSTPTATPTLEDLLKSMNKSLTPVTVCPSNVA
jgi:protein TonB